MSATKEAVFAHAFNVLPGLGALRLGRILKAAGSFESAWTLDDREMAFKTNDEALFAILEPRAKIDPESEWKKLESSGIKAVSSDDKNYSPLLKEIPHPPAILYYYGEFTDIQPSVAVVGTRRATRYGLETAEALARDLASAGICVVSGLALGIDSRAHRGALDAGGKTIAVLGSGLSHIYPAQNKGLAEKIIEKGGAVISEFPPTYPPDRWTFPQRNRIVAGLSRLVIVVEAPQKSGALITANLALDYNRDVGAVPGEISSVNSLGANALLKNGAAVIRSAEDVFEILGIEIESAGLDKTDDTDQYLLGLFEEPMGADAILAKSGIGLPELNQKLTILELSGKIKNIGGIFHKNF